VTRGTFLALTVAATGLVAPWATTARAVTNTTPPHVEVGTLTSASGQDFDYAGSTHHLSAGAPADNTDENIREVFWPSDSTPRVDEEVCAVWDDTADSAGAPDGNRQMGLALRIAPATSDGRGLKAITLTQNVFRGATWIFWVDVWNVKDPAHPDFVGVKSFDLLRVVGFGGRAIAPPWHVCAQAQGATFRFRVWTDGETDPGWQDAQRVFTTRLPAGWDYPGLAGGYVGHLWASQTASMTNLVTRALRSTSGTSSTPSPSGREAPAAIPVLGWPKYVG
jgi:hypothetical protein